MLARPHPIWGDWLHVQAGDMQRLMDRLLNFRDEALEVDPQHTGTPAAFGLKQHPLVDLAHLRHGF